LKWLLAHFIDKCFVGREYPPEQHDKENKEDNKGDQWPDSNMIDIGKNVLIHICSGY
jgi:hypothetical protein